jgi:hypothetical protein
LSAASASASLAGLGVFLATLGGSIRFRDGPGALQGVQLVGTDYQLPFWLGAKDAAHFEQERNGLTILLSSAMFTVGMVVISTGSRCMSGAGQPSSL